MTALTPHALTADRLVCTAPSASRPSVVHTIVANRATGEVGCSLSCRARGEHWHHAAMRRCLADLADMQANQARMTDELLTLQVEWLDPARLGFVCLTWLSAREILAGRRADAA